MPADRIDINADMGEGFGAWPLGQDEALMPLVSSANIACGMHAGDPGTMRRTVALAGAHGVAIGAHPSYPDLVGFGRRAMDLTPDEVYETVLYQMGALEAMVRAAGFRLHHVKPHGALYNRAAKDAALAEAIVEAVHRYDPGLYLYGLSGSEMERVARKRGLPFCRELFADRRYLSDGSLMPRTRPGAVLEEEDEAVAQVMGILLHGRVTCADQSVIPMEGDSFCIHGDGVHAVSFAQALRRAIEAAGIEVGSMPHP
jgi:UPF0271 protein